MGFGVLVVVIASCVCREDVIDWKPLVGGLSSCGVEVDDFFITLQVTWQSVRIVFECAMLVGVVAAACPVTIFLFFCMLHECK